MNDVELKPAVEGAPARSTDRQFYFRVGGLALLVVLAYLVYRIVSPLWQSLV